MIEKDLIQQINEDVIFVADLDEAIVGMIDKENGATVPLYDINKCAELIMKQEGIDFNEAMKHLYFNVINAYSGESTPAFATMFSTE